MLTKPKLPFDLSAREWLNYCLEFRTEAGFIAVFEETWQRIGGQKSHMGAAYEATEQFYEELFGQRKYKDREVLYSARSRFYARQ